MEEKYTIESIQNILKSNDAVMLYFGGKSCSVCHTLRPKIKELFSKQFAKIKQIYLYVDEHPDIAAHFTIFTIPTVVVYFENKEFLKQSRSISISQLEEQIQRVYGLYFDSN
jgi:thioredoxin-like negative regulator of GroEL